MTEPIRINRSSTRKPKPKDADLGFGQIFTDHMFVADFQEEKGWYDPRIEPYGPLSLDPPMHRRPGRRVASRLRHRREARRAEGRGSR